MSGVVAVPYNLSLNDIFPILYRSTVVTSGTKVFLYIIKESFSACALRDPYSTIGNLECQCTKRSL